MRHTSFDVPARVENYLDERVWPSAELGSILVELHAWTSAILAGEVRSDFPQVSTGDSAMVFIQTVTTAITGTGSGMEAEVVRKSLQEALYLTVGTDAELNGEDALGRLLTFLRCRGTAGFLKRFLSVHVFNVVWLGTGDSFRASEWTHELSFENIDNVERVCGQIVSKVWDSLNISRPLDWSSALEVVERIRERLTGY